MPKLFAICVWTALLGLGDRSYTHFVTKRQDASLTTGDPECSSERWGRGGTPAPPSGPGVAAGGFAVTVSVSSLRVRLFRLPPVGRFRQTALS